MSNFVVNSAVALWRFDVIVIALVVISVLAMLSTLVLIDPYNHANDSAAPMI